MQPKAQVVYRKLSELKELPGNPRTISKKQFEEEGIGEITGNDVKKWLNEEEE